jgi:hypothetical protein
MVDDEVERGSDVCVDMFSSPEVTLIFRLQAIADGEQRSVDCGTGAATVMEQRGGPDSRE